jgi:uncharacterized protein YutE (UPF0331/DUF86 family)
LDTAVAQLRRHAGRTREELVANLDEIWSVERGLQICAQNALDVATHLCAASGREAGDYASAIDGLAQLGFVPTDFAARFRAMAGFRNLLVHGYLAIDPERLHRILNERLDDFVEFASHIERALSRLPP